ncbi:phage tail protein [Nonlabens agnitus]|uniref:Phage tail protein n=2 Tax=Nonlabens agnitus TaxID=870484 RepID=A0A2S9WY00_9FLAO|nr:phage tail protein [Nonlabens agnitus]
MIGEIKMFAGNFAPRGWAFCNGQLLAVNQNSALFSILETTYGGDGRTTFALPDLRGRTPVGPGNGPGLSFIEVGQKGGTETHTLSLAEMPSHSHIATGSIPVNTISGDNDEVSPANGVLSNTGDDQYASSASADSMPANVTVGNTGGNLPFNIRNPYQGVHYIIALQGIYPARN